RCPPPRGFGKGRVPLKARGGEAAKIRCHIVGDLARESPAMGEPARMRVALGRQMRNAGHECSNRRETGCLFGEPRDLGAMVANIVLEPEREAMRVARDTPAHFLQPPAAHL